MIRRRLFTGSVAATSALIPQPAAAQYYNVPSLEFGEIVALQGTPHLWIMGADDRLHWAGDTRIISGPIADHLNWNVYTVRLWQLERLPIGYPWLSFRFLKDGDPIYLVKWETWWDQPQLFHIQSIYDVQWIGVNESNYGAYILERPRWEAYYERSVAGWQRHELAPIASNY